MEELVYKTKTFVRWARKVGLRDEELFVAAQEASAGQVEARLGGHVYKKRVALPGGGKSGGCRTIIAMQKGKHSFFLYGFEKNERSNIRASELSVLKDVADIWPRISIPELRTALKAGQIIEVKQGE